MGTECRLHCHGHQPGGEGKGECQVSLLWILQSSSLLSIPSLPPPPPSLPPQIKCHKYWPDDSKQSMTQGAFQIQIQEALVLAEYTVRTFSLQRKGSKTERIVRQFHFTVWPDHGVPEYPAQLLHFVYKVLQEEPLKEGPMVVHCSAGVGRTGTFITLFTQLQRIKAEGNLDVFGFVRSMRRRRCYMVQTEVRE